MIWWGLVALLIALIFAIFAKPGERKQAFSNTFRRVLVFVFVVIMVVVGAWALFFGLALSLPAPNRNSEHQADVPAALAPTTRPTTRPTARSTARPTTIPVDYQCRQYGTSNEYEFGSRYCETFTMDGLLTLSVDHEITGADEYVVLTSLGYHVGMVSTKKISFDLGNTTKFFATRVPSQDHWPGCTAPGTPRKRYHQH